jgi:PhnB protein
MKLTTYINFCGNCEQALRFYEEHLGGKINGMMTYDQQPEPRNIPPGMEKRVLHARITIAGAELYVSDGPPDLVQPMRSVYLTLGVESIEKAEQLYALLIDGGEIFMPIQETFFAHRFAMMRDKFGTSWMIINERARPQL